MADSDTPSRQRQLFEAPYEAGEGSHQPDVSWPSPERFPHNAGELRTGDILKADFEISAGILIVSGYASPDAALCLLGEHSMKPDEPIHITFGFEP